MLLPPQADSQIMPELIAGLALVFSEHNAARRLATKPDADHPDAAASWHDALDTT